MVHFKPKYNLIDAHNADSLGATLGIEQVLTKHIKLSASAEHRVTYDDLTSTLRWRLPIHFDEYWPELVVSNESISSYDGLPNNRITTLGLRIKPSTLSEPAYTIENPFQMNFNNFSSKPAVKMKQVIAAADEKVTTSVCEPSIDSYSPSSGMASESTLVTILGTCLGGTIEVDMDAESSFMLIAENNSIPYNIVSDSELQITIPPHSNPGNYVLTVVTTGGSVMLDDLWVVVAGAPVISEVSPSAGSQSGGTLLTITGNYFASTSSVTIDGASVSFTEVSDTEITFTTPAHAPGAVAIVVTTPGGSATASDGYTYTYDPPSITSLNPDSGTILGGTSVEISGANFNDVSDVTIDGDSIDFTVNNSASITFTTPAHIAIFDTDVDVVVTTPGGTATKTYTYRVL